MRRAVLALPRLVAVVGDDHAQAGARVVGGHLVRPGDRVPRLREVPLSKPGARCRDCSWSVSPDFSPSEVDRRRGARGAGPFPTVSSRTGRASFPASRSPVITSVVARCLGLPPNEGPVKTGYAPRPAQIRQVRAGVQVEGRNNAGSSRTPLHPADRTRTIWQFWHVPALSGPLSPYPAPPGSGCPQLQPACCDRPEAVVLHLRSTSQRLVAQPADLDSLVPGPVVPEEAAQVVREQSNMSKRYPAEFKRTRSGRRRSRARPSPTSPGCQHPANPSPARSTCCASFDRRDYKIT